MTIQEKREALAEDDAKEWDFTTIYDVAMEGCKGYNNMPDSFIEKLYSDQFED